MKFELRDYQTESVQKTRAAYAAGARSPLVVLPTGGGKTIIFCYIAEKIQQQGKRVLILVHRKELLMQASDKLSELEVSHGLIGPGHTLTGDLVQIASVQTLVRRLGKIARPDLIVIDEGHHAAAGTWKKILDNFSDSFFLGVTATPIRLDNKPLGKQCGGLYDTMVEGPNVRWMIDSGYLTQPIVYGPQRAVDLSEVKMRGGEYDSRALEDAFDRPTITGDAIDHYGRLCPGLPAIAFCASVAHAEHTAAQFTAAGYPSYSLTADLTGAQRKHRIESLADGRISVLTSCDIISEGTDIPVVAAAILLRPTQSLGLYLQQVGRVLRPYPGKQNSIILDHAGNCFRHGLPDDVRDWDINTDYRKAKKRDADEGPAIKQCERCYIVFSASIRECPHCGHVAKVKERSIEEVAGELVQMSPDDLEAFKKRSRRQIGRARTLEELREVADRRGYDPGWAYQIYNSRKYRRQYA